MVGRREEGGLGQQCPQTAEASPVLTPVSEEPTETQGPPSLREPRASCETATAIAGEATPANPAAGPTAPTAEPAPGSGPFRASCRPGPWSCCPGAPASPSGPAPRSRASSRLAPAGQGGAAGPVASALSPPAARAPPPGRAPAAAALRHCGGAAPLHPQPFPCEVPTVWGPGLKRKPTARHPQPASRRSLPFHEPCALTVHEEVLERARGRCGRPWLNVPRGERERGPPCHRDTLARTEGT